jgi:PTH2 family peptidyl-tRNA hydrolase
MNNNVKQVLIWRNDLKVRKGKLAAQLAHASLMAYCTSNPSDEAFLKWNDPINEYRKIVLYVNSEEELIDIYKKAQTALLNTAIVRDLGLTELKEPTFTAVAIGPHWDEEINKITSHLSLL